jgi:hypothetical protein
MESDVDHVPTHWELKEEEFVVLVLVLSPEINFTDKIRQLL